MSNMNSVARALGSSLGSSVIASMNSARVAASNLGQAAQNFATAWNHAHTVNTAVITGFRQTTSSLMDVYHNTSMAKTAVDALAQQMGLTKGQIETLNSLVPQFASHTTDAASATQSAASQTAGLRGKVDELNSAISGAAGKIQTAGDQIRSSGQNAQTAAGQLQNFHTQAANAGSAAATAGGKMTTLAGNMSSAGGQAQTAAGKVYSLVSAISGLQSKTITITTNMVTTHSARAGGGPVLPSMPYLVGEEGREMFVPSVPGWIMPHGQTERALAGTAGSERSAPADSGGYNGPSELHSHITITLDNDVVARHTQVEALKWEHRNRRGWSDPGTGP
jgi:ABC-type transporter Mla subunit MlaD